MACTIHAYPATPSYTLTREQNRRSPVTWNTTLPSLCRYGLRHAAKLFCFSVTCCCCCQSNMSWHDRPDCVVNTWSIWEYYIKDVPSPLPAKRPRKLSDAAPRRRYNTLKRIRKSGEQSQSALLDKLPLELREQIYGLVLGDEMVIHIVRRCSSAISSFRCKTSKGGETMSHEECRVWSDYRGPDQRIGDLLPLLLTCREM